MKKIFLLILFLLVGCGEQYDLQRENKDLRAKIETAKQVEILKIERDKLKVELNKIQTSPEANEKEK